MRLLALLGLVLVVLAQEVQYVTVSDNQEDLTPSSGFEPAAMVDAPHDESVAETKFSSQSGLEAVSEQEEALVETEARVSAPRQYSYYNRKLNTGEVLSEHQETTPRKCLQMCSSDSQRRCKGFNYVNNKRICQLLSSLGGIIPDGRNDFYEARDYEAAPIAFKSATEGETVPVKAEISLNQEKQLLIFADVSRVRAPRNDLTIELQLSVDGNHEFAGTTNINNHYGETEAYRSPSFHSLSLPQGKGTHRVALTYKRDHTNGPVILSDVAGRASAVLTVLPLPLRTPGAKVPYEAAGQVWNSERHLYLYSPEFTAIPSERMQIKFHSQDEQALFVLGEINRFQHVSGRPSNAEFRVMLDGKQQIAYSNTGYAYGWDFKQVTLRGAAKKLAAGEHTLSVEYRTTGSAYLFSDVNGRQQRRLTAFLVPNKRIWNVVQKVDNNRYAPIVKRTKEWKSSFSRRRSVPLKLTITPDASGKVLVFADLARVQTLGRENVEFMVAKVNDGERTPIGFHNTGIVQGWRFTDIHFHTTFDVKPDEVGQPINLQVFFRTRTGGPVGFFDDGNGHQQRSLTAILVESVPGNDKVFGGRFANAGFSLPQ